MSKELSPGYVRIQVNPERVVCLDKNSDWHGWVFFRAPNGNLVSMGKLDDFQLRQAEQQRDAGIVNDGGHNLSSKCGIRFG